MHLLGVQKAQCKIRVKDYTRDELLMAMRSTLMGEKYISPRAPS